MEKLRLPEQNEITLIGRLTRDPELRFTPKGMAVCKFDIAVNRRYKSGEEWKDEVSFIPVVVWSQAAERCGARLKKGHPVHVAGRLRSNSFQTKDGQKRTVLEVVAQRIQFLSWPSDGVSAAKPASGPSPAAEPKEEVPEILEEAAAATVPSNDEEVPF